VLSIPAEGHRFRGGDSMSIQGSARLHSRRNPALQVTSYKSHLTPQESTDHKFAVEAEAVQQRNGLVKMPKKHCCSIYFFQAKPFSLDWRTIDRSSHFYRISRSKLANHGAAVFGVVISRCWLLVAGLICSTKWMIKEQIRRLANI
jgi:hypothetical protein